MIEALRVAARFGLVAAAVCASSQVAAQSAAEPFYKGKRLAVMVNFAPGGSTDIEGRLFARHVARHLEGQPNVVVERSFDAPQAFERAHALEEAKAWCLEQHRVRWVRSYLSSDGRRMLCLYRAPDAESVRLAQREASLDFDVLWSCERIGYDTMPA